MSFSQHTTTISENDGKQCFKNMNPSILLPCPKGIRMLMIFIISSLFLSCNSSGSKAPGSQNEEKTTPAENENIAFDACTILDKSVYAEALGEDVKDGKTLIDAGNMTGETRVSHCLFNTVSGSNKYVGILIRRDKGKNVNPGSREAYLQQSAKEDESEMANDARNAILKGKKLNGIGDVAFTYELEGLGTTLMAFWKGNYMLQVTINGLNEEDSIAKAEKIAKAIIDRL